MTSSIAVRSSSPLPSGQQREQDFVYSGGRLSESGRPGGPIGYERADKRVSTPRSLHDSSAEESDASHLPSSPPASATVLPSRPMTLQGSPSTWPRRNISEQRLAASLDQLNAKNLAVHLYDAFALKASALNLEGPREGNDQIGGRAFIPPRAWTAWPLAPGIVPTEDEDLQWESETDLLHHTRTKKTCPRETLEEILIGLLQKQAKERFRKRQRHDASLGLPDVDLGGDEGANDADPVVLADDELARNITQPTVHHVMAKLDELLTGLHHARKAYTMIGDSASDSHDYNTGQDVRQQRSKSERDGCRRRKTIPRSSSKVSPSHVEAGVDAGNTSSEHSTAPNFKRSKVKYQRVEGGKRPKRQQRWGLRDWSDISGVAAMTGWEPSIVGRAAARCSNLFEQGMKFRTFEEHDNAWNETAVLPTKGLGETDGGFNDFSKRVQPLNPESSHALKRRPSDRDAQGWRFYCPITECNRSSHGFYEACRLTRHVKQVHKDIDLDNLSYEKEDEMVGGVHVDGFLQPVQVSRAWATKKSRPGRSKRTLRQSQD